MALKIVLVEDNFIIQMFLEEIATNMGHEVLGTADSGEEALNILDKIKPDVALLDIGLSGNYNGIELARIINRKHQIPFVFVTGNSDRLTISKAKSVHPLHIIYKPIDEDKLKEELDLIEEKLNMLQPDLENG